MAVDTFAADILACNSQDGSLLLIENQFKASDHGYLGQILTYLAGLEAKTIIWIAPSFRPSHLSAIRWINNHTDEPYAFFAIQLKVVRIASSPMVPVFEVVERPNDWDRQVQEIAREARAPTELGAFRKAFWSHLVARHSSESKLGAASGASSRWRPIEGTDLVVAQYLSKRGVGMFIRGVRGADPAVAALIAPHPRNNGSYPAARIGYVSPPPTY